MVRHREYASSDMINSADLIAGELIAYVDDNI